MDGLDAVERAARFAADVVLRTSACRAWTGSRPRAGRGDCAAAGRAVLTTFGLDENVVEALRAGAGGFLLKDAPSPAP